MRNLLLNVAAMPVAAFLAYWVPFGLRVWSYDTFTSLAWHRRRIFKQPSYGGAVFRGVIFASIPLTPPVLVFGGLWLFKPAVLAWAWHAWGAWAGAAIGLLAALMALLGTSSEERRATFYDENRNEIAPKLGVRQASYLKPFLEAWEAQQAKTAAGAQEGDAEEAEDEEAGDDSEARGSDVPQPRLDFEILEVATGQGVTEAPPYRCDGGDWTVCTCRTSSEPPALFVFGERSRKPTGAMPFAWGEARLWVASTEDGAHLADGLSRAFLVPPRKPIVAGAALCAPLAFNTAVLSREAAPQADGSLTQGGTWTASKWFYEEATEFYVNWSTEEKFGYFAEKDESHRPDLAAAFRRLAG